jgi:hypothetical protein
VLALGEAETAPSSLFTALPGGPGLYAGLKTAQPRLSAAV